MNRFKIPKEVSDFHKKTQHKWVDGPKLGPKDTIDEKYRKIKPYSKTEIKLFEKFFRKYVKSTSLRI